MPIVIALGVQVHAVSGGAFWVFLNVHVCSVNLTKFHVCYYLTVYRRQGQNVLLILMPHYGEQQKQKYCLKDMM